MSGFADQKENQKKPIGPKCFRCPRCPRCPAQRLPRTRTRHSVFRSFLQAVAATGELGWHFMKLQQKWLKLREPISTDIKPI
jgi:hypothetical protein